MGGARPPLPSISGVSVASLVIQSGMPPMVKGQGFLGNLWHRTIIYETFTETS